MWEQWSKPKAEGGDISTIWVQVTNPGQSLPNADVSVPECDMVPAVVMNW